MNYETHGFEQGSAEWKANRAICNNASELVVAAGASRKMMRDEFVRLVATGDEKEFSDWVQRNVLDRGHTFEDLARPMAEELIGEPLYPAVMSLQVEGLSRRLGSSVDGKTMSDQFNWEHKTLNAELEASLEQGIIPDDYHWQMEQGMRINHAEKCLFTASKWEESPGDDEEDGRIYGYAMIDGIRTRFVLIDIKHAWYEPNPDLRAKIVPVWKQFEEDVANYVPSEVIPAAVAAPIKDLPALSVQIVGNVMASNLAEWKSVVSERIQAINTDLQDDQDFADATKTVTFLEDGEKKIDLVKSQAQSQAIEIDELFRALDDIKATMRAKRLELNKLVEKRKEEVRAEILMSGKNALACHIAGLNKRLSRVLMPPIPADFAGAMKGKRTVESLKNAVNTVLANAKIDADTIADRVEKNLATLDDLAKDHMALFADIAHIAMKECDDFAVLVKMRIADHKAAEEKRLEAERERIRKEEQTKLELEQAKNRADQQTTTPEGEAGTSPVVAAPVSSIERSPVSKPAAISRIVTPREKLNELLTRVKDDQITLVIHYVERLLISQEQEAA